MNQQWSIEQLEAEIDAGKRVGRETIVAEFLDVGVVRESWQRSISTWRGRGISMMRRVFTSPSTNSFRWR